MNRTTLILLAGIVVILLVALVPIMLGITFGQRCTKIGFVPDSPNWHACITQLSNGTKEPR